MRNLILILLLCPIGMMGQVFTSYSAVPSIPIFVSCGDSFTVFHVTSGNVAPVDKTVTYKTVSTDLTGTTQCWITKNLGATRQATSPTDTSEDASGWYFQFNRKKGYQYIGTTRTPSSWNSTISENLDWETANDPCELELGTGWRVPTSTEWDAVVSNGRWTDYDDDATGSFGSVLKIHAGGYLADDGRLNDRGNYAALWSSNQAAADEAIHLFVSSSVATGGVTDKKAYGTTLRCVKD